jgi:hypothetical protein
MDDRLKDIQKLLDSIDGNLTSARNMIRELTGQNIEPLNIDEKLGNLNISDEGKVIEGIFDGEAMLAPDGQTYPIPPNYASKSKLIEGDTLKLTISDDGSFIFKQIAPVERRNAIGTLTNSESGYTISAEGKSYRVLTASVTFYKAEPGDQVTIILPKDHDANWAVLENVIKKASQESVMDPEAEPEIIIPEPTLPTVEVETPVAPVIPPEAQQESEILPITSDQENNFVPKASSEPEVPTDLPSTPEPQIEFPGGNTPLSDDELLKNLKENLKTLDQPEYLAPENTAPITPKPVDNIVANDLNKIENKQTDDKQIAELDI